MKRLLLIRHAESTNNVQARRFESEFSFNVDKIREKIESSREADPSLSQRGLAQAKSLSSKLKDALNPQKILLVSSPMRRALMTALEIAVAMEIPRTRFLCHGKLYEVGGCYYQKKAVRSATPTQIKAEFPVTNVQMNEEGWYFGFNLRETDAQAECRVEEMVSWIESTLSDEKTLQTLVLVTHGDFLNRLIRNWLGTPKWRPVAIVHGNTGISTIEWSDFGEMLLVGLNDESHLPSELRSTVGQDWWRETVPGLSIDRYVGMDGIPSPIKEHTFVLRQRHLLFPDDKTIEDYEQSDARNTHFVACWHGVLCGYVQYDPLLNRLRQLVVTEEFRGHGFAKLLVMRVKAEARSLGATDLNVHAWHRAVEFYRRLGFVFKGELNRDSKMPWLLMTMKL